MVGWMVVSSAASMDVMMAEWMVVSMAAQKVVYLAAYSDA